MSRAVPTRTWHTLARVVHVSRPKGLLLCATALVAGFADAGTLLLVVRIAVTLIDGSDRTTSIGPIGLDLSMTGLFVAAAILITTRLALSATAGWLTADIVATSLGQMRKRTFAAFVEASWATQSVEADGHLQELMTTHVNRIAMSLSSLTLGVVGLLNFVALLVTAFVVNPVASGAGLVGTLLLFVLVRPLARASKGQSRSTAEANLRYVETVAESVAVAEETQVFGTAPALRLRHDALVDDVVAPIFQNQLLNRLLPAINQAAAMALVLLGLVAVRAVGATGVGSLGAVVLLLVRTLTYTQGLQTAYQEVGDVVPYAEQLATELDRYGRAALDRTGRRLPAIRSLAFSDVSFTYRHGAPPVLNDVSFTVDHPETIGIVGPSGAGKSTLVQLLVRLRQPTGGTYLVNGTDARTFSADDWCPRVAFLPQDSRLFSGTVADNIRFFRSDVSDAEVEAAARLAHVHDEIVSWRDAYQTRVGARGGEVSGGQRQRICLARALLQRPDVLVLDEPTSALDPRSESLVQDTLAGLAGTVTVFIVAHRLTALSTCDRIMVLGDGRIQAFDRASKLVTSNPYYREAVRLWER